MKMNMGWKLKWHQKESDLLRKEEDSRILRMLHHHHPKGKLKRNLRLHQIK